MLRWSNGPFLDNAGVCVCVGGITFWKVPPSKTLYKLKTKAGPSILGRNVIAVLVLLLAGRFVHSGM